MSNILATIKKSTICHLTLAISYFTSGLIINVAQCILFICVKPFNVKLYRYLMYYLCYSFYCQLVFIADWWAGCKIKIYISKEDLATCGKEHGLLLMNHFYEVDWLLGWVFCDKIGVLGNCKAYAKKAIQYIPTIGWAWKFAEFVFLERNLQKDREIIGKQIRKILAYPHAVWLLLNAEGTRFTKTKHEASVKFAEERGMTPLQYHLIPRTKGFTVSLPYLKENCPNVYDINLAITDDQVEKATISNLLKGEGVEAHMYVQRYDTKSIPDGEEAAAEWLQELFRHKDRMQQNFHKHGSFFHGLDIAPIEPITFEPRLACLLNTAGWTLTTLSVMLYYLGLLLLSGRLIPFSIGIGLLGLFYWLLNKSISYSKIEKGSSYGSKVSTPINGNSRHEKNHNNGNYVKKDD
ncbi:1-acyl-sn-glycerol-3-phosphate acyltransferase gamma-like [Culicoides brevitarsis]|uniref:1-acyl-sn-glycerol-3-phosphate acyltransferase gamma-like n=1 Tax=Culicoides brevitarsis TaxID=469753 RepID=UPI00307B6BB8